MKFAVALVFAGSVRSPRAERWQAQDKKPDTDLGLAREGFYRFAVLTVSLFATVVALGHEPGR